MCTQGPKPLERLTHMRSYDETVECQTPVPPSRYDLLRPLTSRVTFVEDAGEGPLGAVSQNRGSVRLLI